MENKQEERKGSRKERKLGQRENVTKGRKAGAEGRKRKVGVGESSKGIERKTQRALEETIREGVRGKEYQRRTRRGEWEENK